MDLAKTYNKVQQFPHRWDSVTSF